MGGCSRGTRNTENEALDLPDAGACFCDRPRYRAEVASCLDAGLGVLGLGSVFERSDRGVGFRV